MKRVFKDIPIDEITLRRFEKPLNNDLKSLIRKFAISIGLLQPGDSRDIMSQLLFSFINASKRQEFLLVDDIIAQFKNEKGGTPNNIRRHIRRLKDLSIIERTTYGYRLKEFLPLSEIFEEYILKYTINPSIARLKEYCKTIDENDYSS